MTSKDAFPTRREFIAVATATAVAAKWSGFPPVIRSGGRNSLYVF
jgi:hypothetical protein